MSASLGLQMSMENIHRDKKKVFISLLQAQQESALLEIALAGETSPERYGSRLLPFPGYEGGNIFEDDILAEYARKLRDAVNDEEGSEPETRSNGQGIPESFTIVPLEPTTGNLKIRKVPQVVIRFFLGLELYELATMFQKVVLVSGAQAIQLAMPGMVRIRPRRQQQRISVPPRANMTVTVQKRGSNSFNATLSDLSPGGLSFSCSEKHDPLMLGDKVGVTIHGPILQGTPLSTFGSICRMTRAREEVNVQEASQHYGVQFKLVSVADAMTIDRLVK
ncbi:MAG: PilZ domain-containing protein, partial [Magnetococcales bacterium]|nr:PilZ domain-containing protein [Magnetococcales bacterium]